MKRFAILVTAIFFLTGLVAGFTANAQMHQGNDQQTEQHQDMMKGDKKPSGMQGMKKGKTGMKHHGMMMQKPMKKYMMMVQMLPATQDQLSLSQDQTVKLIDLQTDFKKQQVDFDANLTKEKMKMKSLLEKEAAADKVKNQMSTCAGIKIDMKVAAYETAKKMKAVLTDKQIEQMKDMMMQHGGMMKGCMMHGGGMMGK